MNHPFRVGGRYRNRRGTYTVEAVHPPSMTIVYADGTRADVNLTLQARIWSNIQLETEGATEDDLACVEDAAVVGENQFAGLRASDFKEGVTGTCWRAKDNLGGLLAARLTDKAAIQFAAYAIYRRPVVHVVRPECYSAEASQRKAKLFIRLDRTDCTYGLTLEKGDTKMDASWDWPRFLDVMRSNADIQTAALSAMIIHDLGFDVYQPSNAEDRDVEIIARIEVEGGELVRRDKGAKSATPMTWESFCDYAEALPADSWGALCLCRHLRKAQAISQGAELAERIADVYRTLVPIYCASTCALEPCQDDAP